MEFWTACNGLTKLRPMPVNLADFYDSWIQDVIRAEELGFDGINAPEHHFMYDGFIPSPLQALSAAAAVTSKVRLATGAMLLTLYDPLEAAEMAATADLLSNGRISLGLGMGYRPMEFDAFGTAKKTRGARLTEGMEVMKLATSQESFSYQGKHYQYKDASIAPRPVQKPLDLWYCGGTTTVGARRAGTAGLGYWLATSPLDASERIIKEYRQFGREAGWADDQLRTCVFKDIFIGETVEEAKAMAHQMMEYFYDEHILGYGYLVDETGKNLYNPPKDHPLYERFVDSLTCGTVEMIIDELKKYEAIGVDTVMIQSTQQELIAEKVLPELRR